MSESCLKSISALTAVLVIAAVAPASAQYYWMSPDDDNSVHFEFLKTRLTEESPYGFFTSVWFVRGEIQISQTGDLIVEIPYSHIAWTTNVTRDNQTAVGSPYIGVEFLYGPAYRSSSLRARFGFRPPLASDDRGQASALGRLTAFDRFEAFVPDYWTINFGLGIAGYPAQGARATLDCQTTILAPAESDGDTEIFFDYGVALWAEPDALAFGMGLAGRLLATQGDLTWDERTFHHLALATHYRVGNFKPGLQLRLPLDEVFESNGIDYIYGAHLVYVLR